MKGPIGPVVTVDLTQFKCPQTCSSAVVYICEGGGKNNGAVVLHKAIVSCGVKKINFIKAEIVQKSMCAIHTMQAFFVHLVWVLPC